MWYGADRPTDRQVGRACGHTDHAERKEEWSGVGPGHLNKQIVVGPGRTELRGLKQEDMSPRNKWKL